MTTGLPPPAPSGTPPPRIQLPTHALTPGEVPAEQLDRERAGVEGEWRAHGQRSNLAAAALPAALIVFLILAFVAIAWTLVASAT